MDPYEEVPRIVERELAARAVGADGWPWAWSGGMSLVTDVISGRTERWIEMSIVFDRDRCPEDLARRLSSELETVVRAELADQRRLVIDVYPTTRLDRALLVVKEHVECCSRRDRDRLQRIGAWLPEVKVVRAWTADGDRILMEIASESSADESVAESLGREWMASLPPYSTIVDVVGSTH